MADWKSKLAVAKNATTLTRARRSMNKGVEYRLGKGGFNPDKPLGSRSDCSGFVAWAIGIPRELPPQSGNWLQTTSYWNGGPPAGEGLFDRIDESEARPGDVIVYPDRGRKQGHMGIVASVADGKVQTVIHCSNGNYRSHGDAIRETPPTVFQRSAKTRILRVDYPALRDLAGLPEPEDEDVEVVDTPFPEVQLRHPLLADNATLQRVAEGTLVLESTGGRVGGCVALHRAMNLLAEDQPRWRVDLGPNERHLGFFGGKTKRALKKFQEDNGLSVTGELDSATLLAIDQALAVPAEHGTAAETASIKVRVRYDGRDWHGRIAEEEFVVGRRVSYGNRRGLANHYWQSGATYQPAAYEAEHGHWAWMIQPTAKCESRGHFNCINTYDRARFTFGFYQMAAHTPNANFVKLLRRLLSLPQASAYFPDLALEDDRVARQSAEGVTEILETSASTEALMDYLNPGDRDVEEAEVIQAAKLIHWCEHDPEHQHAQVASAIEKVKGAMPGYHRRYGLSGRVDSVCLVVADIRHQGRARSAEIIAALDAPTERKALSNLLEIGAHAYRERVRTLASEVRRLTAEGILGTRRYDSLANEFR